MSCFDKETTLSPRWEQKDIPLTVGFLESGSGTTTTKLLWLWLSRVSNQQSSVVGDEGLLQLVLGLFIDELLVVGNQTLSNGLSDGVDLGGVTTTGDTDSDVNVGELVQTNQDQWLVNLESQDFWLNKGDWGTVNLDQTLTFLDMGDSGG